MSDDKSPDAIAAEAARRQDLEPILDWIRQAEAHLAALQGAFEQLRDGRNADRAAVDRALAGTTALEARIEDLERACTELAVTIARLRADRAAP